MNDNNSTKIGCAIQLWNSRYKVTVANEGHFSERQPVGVDVACSETPWLQNASVFYVHSPGSSASDQGLQVGGTGAFEIWTSDGYKLAFNRERSGPNSAQCPVHTDATEIGEWEVLVFTKLLEEPVPSTVPQTAVPYLIQTRSACYLQSIPGRYDYENQPMYKSLEANEDAYKVQFVELPPEQQRDWDKEFDRIWAKKNSTSKFFRCFRHKRMGARGSGRDDTEASAYKADMSSSDRNGGYHAEVPFLVTMFYFKTLKRHRGRLVYDNR